MRAAPDEIEASALLATVVETCGGDIRVAFSRLCASVDPEAIEGECFRTALARAVGDLIARTASARPPIGDAS